jgi:adenosine deaminase CECR1
MGTFCSVNKGAESDEHDKDVEDSPSNNSHGMPSRQPKMTASNPKSNRQRRNSPQEFRFQFQDDIADCANGCANSNEAKAMEAEANDIIADMRVEDEAVFRRNYLSSGQHFVDVRDFLRDTRLFHVAAMVPKGAHLHLHFNSTLLPGVLLGYAKDMPNMYIWSDHQLLGDSDFKNCKLEFSLRNLEQVRAEMHKQATESQDISMLEKLKHAESLSDEDAKIRAYDELAPDIFSSTYKHGRRDKNQHVEEMRYQYFRQRWDEITRRNCDEWLISKLTFSREEVNSFFTDADNVDLEGESDTERKPTRVNSIQSNPAPPALNGDDSQPFNEPGWIAATKRNISASDYKRNRIWARK